jgi:3-phenylpropionate/trans-cinnamate dioxygenase ferredoxin reductase subunit
MSLADVSSADPIVIVGGGHAAAALCAALAEAGQGARVTLVSAESELPYQRPPLSKAYLKSPEATAQAHRPAAWYEASGIRVRLGDAAVQLDRGAKTLRLASGTVLPYARLVLATGTRARRLPLLPAELDNVAVLRSAADALALRTRLGSARALTVIGGGFIGLEVAATARALGLEVEVIEAAPRLLMRSVSAELSQHVLEQHRASGIRVRLGATLGGAETEGGRLVALTVDGERHAVDLALLGIGAEPETALAEAAGLAVDNGILVDAQLHTADPAILAIGDCARFPHAGSGQALRLESVQNANDQARTAAASLLGAPAAYAAVPWFWSEQGAMRLQMVGLLSPDATTVRRPGAHAASFTLFHFVGDRLVCAESVNAPMDHLMARKLIEGDRHPAPAQLADPAVALKSLL